MKLSQMFFYLPGLRWIANGKLPVMTSSWNTFSGKDSLAVCSKADYMDNLVIVKRMTACVTI